MTHTEKKRVRLLNESLTYDQEEVKAIKELVTMIKKNYLHGSKIHHQVIEKLS